jgi:hypothetical protein
VEGGGRGCGEAEEVGGNNVSFAICCCFLAFASCSSLSAAEFGTPPKVLPGSQRAKASVAMPCGTYHRLVLKS